MSTESSPGTTPEPASNAREGASAAAPPPAPGVPGTGPAPLGAGATQPLPAAPADPSGGTPYGPPATGTAGPPGGTPYGPPAGPPTGPPHGATPPPRPAEPSAPVGWVIAAMILFWPTGIPALLASHRAARAFGGADLETGRREAATARRWGIVSVSVGAGLILLSILASIVWAVLLAVAIDRVDDGEWHRYPGWSNEMPFDDQGRPALPDRPGSGI